MVDDPRYVARKADIDWLNEQLLRFRIPQRRLAEAMQVDPSSLNRSLAGTRKMKRDEFARALAFIEGVVPRHANRLVEAVWEARLSSVEIASRTGMPPERVFNILSGIGDDPSRAELKDIAGRLGLDLDTLLADEGTPVRSLLREARPTLLRSGTRRLGPDYQAERVDLNTVDIYRAPVPVGKGLFSGRQDVAEQRPRPPGLDNAVGAFGLFLGDDTLAPRYLAGEVLFIHPGKPALVGRWVVADLTSGRMAIGTLKSSAGDVVELTIDDKAKPIKLQRAEISAISPIVGCWSE